MKMQKNPSSYEEVESGNHSSSQLHNELEKLSLEIAELNKNFAEKYHRFNQLLAKWKKLHNTSIQ